MIDSDGLGGAAESAIGADGQNMKEPADTATKKMQELLDIQKREAMNGDSYMLGLYNGMLLTCSTIDKTEYLPMNRTAAQQDLNTLGNGQSDNPVPPAVSAAPTPKWWHCKTHGRGNPNEWGCPECVREMREIIKMLRRELAPTMTDLMVSPESIGDLPDTTPAAEKQSEAEHQMDMQVVANFEARVTELERERDELRAADTYIKIAGLEADLDMERDIVNRIWEIYGNPPYEELKGRSIFDLINADRAERDDLRAALVKLSRQLNSVRADVDHALWPTGGFAEVEKK